MIYDIIKSHKNSGIHPLYKVQFPKSHRGSNDPPAFLGLRLWLS